MSKDAIIIIDMLNDFIEKNAALRCPDGEKIVPALQNLVAFARENGIQLVFVQDAHRKNDADFLVRPIHAIKGSQGSQFIDELQPHEEMGDYVVSKRRK